MQHTFNLVAICRKVLNSREIELSRCDKPTPHNRNFTLRIQATQQISLGILPSVLLHQSGFFFYVVALLHLAHSNLIVSGDSCRCPIPWVPRAAGFGQKKSGYDPGPSSNKQLGSDAPCTKYCPTAPSWKGGTTNLKRTRPRQNPYRSFLPS
jgi:hypothetical protein